MPSPALRPAPVLRHAVVLAACLLAMPARAGTHVVDVAAGMDAAFTGSGLYLLGDLSRAEARSPSALMGGPPKQGIFLVRYQYRGLFGRKLAAGAEFNTDTVSGDISAWDVGLPGVGLGVFGRAEALLAGVNINHMKDGRNQVDRGFAASYAMVGARASYTVLRHLTVEAEGAARGWAFTRLPQTSRDFRMPAPHLTAEPRVRLKWHGATFRRRDLGLAHGLNALVEVAADIRALNQPWGGKRGEPVDARNNVAPGTVARRVVVLAQAGGKPHRKIHVGGAFQAGYGDGEDDITRTRVGGLNPYTVNMPGAAWGEYLAERYAAGMLQAGVVATPFLYVGATLHAAAVNDPARVGALDDVGFLRGASAEVRMAFLDYFLCRLQVGGNADVVRPDTRGAIGAFAWVEAGLWI